MDVLPPVINKTIANVRYAVKLDGYTLGILKNRIDKTNVNIVLIDKENNLPQEQKLTLILWARKLTSDRWLKISCRVEWLMEKD
ncbi:hypothetical protein [Methanobrevibacter sp.]|uniref:hypothetical protein n=1 Tax=Methanobrevibacter sp. TaxID=66852 RepID=UPI0038907AF8